MTIYEFDIPIYFYMGNLLLSFVLLFCAVLMFKKLHETGIIYKILFAYFSIGFVFSTYKLIMEFGHIVETFKIISDEKYHILSGVLVNKKEIVKRRMGHIQVISVDDDGYLVEIRRPYYTNTIISGCLSGSLEKLDSYLGKEIKISFYKKYKYGGYGNFDCLLKIEANMEKEQ